VEEKIRLKQYVSLRSRGRHNYELAAVPKFSDQRVITAINNRRMDDEVSMLHVNSLESI
jgi:hypothetical protein